MAPKKDSEKKSGKNTFAFSRPVEVVNTPQGQFVRHEAISDFESQEDLIKALNEAGLPATADIPSARGSSLSMSGLGDNYKRVFGHDGWKKADSN